MGDKTDNQYLTFVLDGETYAVPVGKVREVLEYIKPSKLPKTVDYMKGVINVRGTGIPVVDLRVKFEMAELPITGSTAIIVMEIMDAEGDQHVIGALADEVHEVIEMNDEQLERAPRFGTMIDTGFVRNVGKHDGVFVIVLDIDRVFNEAAVIELSEAASTVSA
jgi:purine-binding chemotaxis protein CheW